MDKFDNIDDLFSKLGNDEKQPPSVAWQYILADQKRKKRAGMLWCYYGFAGLILVGGLIGYYQFKSDKASLQSNNVAKREVLAKNANTESSNNPVSETPNTPRTHIASVTSSIPTAYSSFFSKPNISIGSTSNSNNNITEVEVLLGPEIDVTENVITKTNTSEDEIATTTLTVPLQDKGINNEEEEKDKKIRKDPLVKIQKWFIEPVVMGTYSFRTLKGGADMTDYINQRNRSEVRLLKLGFGATIGKALNKNLNFQGGILYNIQGLSASYTASTAQKKVFVEVDPTLNKYASSAIYIYVHDSVYKLEKGNAINGDQKFHYIRIPFLVEGQIGIKKTTYSFYGGVGVSLNWLLAARGDIQDYQSTQSSVFVPVNQVSLQRFGADVIARTGFLMPLFGKPDIQFSVGFRGIFSPISAFSKEVPVKQYNRTIGFEVGIRKIVK